MDVLRVFFEDRYNFHYGSCRQFINDSLETEVLSESEVWGLALRNAVSDCVDRGFDRESIRLIAESMFLSGENPLAVQSFIARRALDDLSSGRDVDVFGNLLNLTFSCSRGGYRVRTYENAQAEEVDFTFAFAANFRTAGEKCTALAAGDSLVRIDLPMKAYGGIDVSRKGIDKAVGQILDQLPDEYVSGTPCFINIAGNGLQSMKDFKITQNQADTFLCVVGAELFRRGMVISGIRTGGQTGMDEAGAVMGCLLGIPTHVHGPAGWYFRNAEGKDFQNEEAFKARFFNKDYRSLHRSVDCFVKERKTSKGLNFGL